MASITNLPKNIPLAVLESYGATSISVENNHLDLVIDSDDLGYLRIPEGPKFNINIETDAEGLERLQKALKNEPRSEESELKHELKTIHAINECKGDTFNERAENYLLGKEKQSDVVYNELLKSTTNPAYEYDDGTEEPGDDADFGALTIMRYKLIHR